MGPGFVLGEAGLAPVVDQVFPDGGLVKPTSSSQPVRVAMCYALDDAESRTAPRSFNAAKVAPAKAALTASAN
jgi:hypothetical protein